MAIRMQQRRGTSAQWTAANPILTTGEIGFETDTGQFKIGDGVNVWSNISYFKNLEDLGGTLDDYLKFFSKTAAQWQEDSAQILAIGEFGIVNDAVPVVVKPGDGVTAFESLVPLASYDQVINVNSILVTIDETLTTVIDDLASHAGLTTNVHGILDTSDLITSTSLSEALDPIQSDITTINQALDNKVESSVAASTYAPKNSPTITGTAVLPSTTTIGTVTGTEISYLSGTTSAIQTQINSKAPTENPTFTGTVSGITKSMVGLGNVDNTSDASKPVSTATQTALDLKANLAAPTFTGTVVLPSTTSIGNVSSTELGYVDGVTSSIQTQINGKLSLSGGTMTGDLTLSGAPTTDLHAATKAYVDNVVSGINFHQPVRVATTANITLSGTQTIDGIALSVGDRVLVKNQTDQKTNGIYVVASSTWSRATDADNNPAGELAGGDFCLVLEGTVNEGYGYVCSNTSTITIGTTNITYTPFNAAKAIVAGTGLEEATPGTLSIATGGVTSSMILDGTIVNADINTSAAIDQSKISGLSTSLAAKAPLADPTFTGTVTVSASGVAFTDGTQTKQGVPSLTTISQQTGAYTTVLSDRDKLIEINSATGVTLTIPLNSSVAYPIGTSLDILQTGAGQVTIAGTAGVTVNATPGLKLRTQWSSATLFKRATDTWVVFGDLTA